MLREKLGDFSSIVCMRAIITGMEDALGEKATAIALISAGRTRGKKLVSQLGFAGADLTFEEIARQLNQALGEQGTRLCIIEKIERVDDLIRVYTLETVCSAGEPQGSERKCTYTLGTVGGALEKILGKRLLGRHTESVLRGGTHDVFEFTEISYQGQKKL